jgi:DNA-binding IclR family transcriptional regulator
VHCTGVGKVIAAFQPSNIIDRIVSKHELTEHTEHTITTYRDLKKEFEKIRNEGVAYDLEEHEVGIICIAAPIRNHISQVVGSISITSITQRMTSEQLGGMKDLLVDAADTVSQRLGFRKKSQI